MKSLLKLLVLAGLVYGGWWLVQEGHVELGWPPFGGTEVTPASGECVDLNEAPESELGRIVHITDQRARDIRRLRLEGSIRSLDDLSKVPGIGSGRIDDIRRQGLVCDL